MSVLPSPVIQIGSGWFSEHPGGLERVFHALWRYLPEEGFSVRGLVVGSPRVSRETGGTVQAVAAPDASLPRRLRGMRQALSTLSRQHPPALIAGHFALYLFPLQDMLRRQPFVMHFHGPWALESNAESETSGSTLIKRLLERQVYRQATHCVVLSHAFKEVLERHYAIPPHRITVIPGGVDSDRFRLSVSRPEARRLLGLPPDRPLLLTVRRLRHRMGLSQLLKATRNLREAFPELLVLIAGKGPLYTSLQTYIEENNLHNHVRLSGFVPENDLPLLYRAADLTLMPSQALEGFGLTTLESLAAGTPVLATPVGGLPEILHPLNPQLLLPDTSIEALTETLRSWLLGQLPLPDAASCQQYVDQHFTWHHMVRKTADLYRALL